MRAMIRFAKILEVAPAGRARVVSNYKKRREFPPERLTPGTHLAVVAASAWPPPRGNGG
jgi:hypothetical protein